MHCLLQLHLNHTPNIRSITIILFFKVWGMTNDIKDIRNKYLKDEDEKQRKNTEHDAITKISGGSKPTI